MFFFPRVIGFVIIWLYTFLVGADTRGNGSLHFVHKRNNVDNYNNLKGVDIFLYATISLLFDVSGVSVIT